MILMRAIPLALLALTAADEPPQPAIDGRWVNPGETVIIDIGPCGEARCGTVKWASDKAIDDAKKGTAQLVGSDLLTGLEEQKPGRWRGKLFIPDKKLRVTARITLQGEGRLKVTGCAVGVCRSQLWNRSDEALPGL